MRDSDRRVKYTRMVLRESLMELLQKKPIARVSVTEICKSSQLNRGTFYAHYQDPFDLLKQIEEDLYIELQEAIGQNAESGDVDEMLRGVMGVLDRNRDMCRVILGDNGSPRFVERILGMARAFFVGSWACKQGVPEGTADYIYRYLSAGSVDVIRHWLTSDDARSVGEVTRIISGICKSIISASMERARKNS